MKIYTRTGDDGQTGLIGGQRVSKDSLRIEAYGTLDELSAVLGLACAEGLDAQAIEWIQAAQRHLFEMGAELANPSVGQPSPEEGSDASSETEIGEMETWIDRLERSLPPLRNFILPGGTAAAARLHVARTICRRAERRVVTLAENIAISPRHIRYLNRLSDLLFVMARAANQSAGIADISWVPGDPVQ